jgi:alpha-D-ribose 1-methylphosphonate 5-triphosphate diphosphatase PhnM
LHINCLLEHVIEGQIKGKIKVTGRRGRRSTQLLDCHKEKRDSGNWKRKHYIALRGELAVEEALDLS